MVKIINKTKSVIILGSYELQPGINYISKNVYDSFWNNGVMQLIITAREKGKIEVIL